MSRSRRNKVVTGIRGSRDKSGLRSKGNSAIGVAIVFMGLAFYSAVKGDWVQAGLSLFASFLSTLAYFMHQRVTDPKLKKTLSYIYFAGFVILIAAVVILGGWRP